MDYDDTIPTIIRCIVYWIILVSIIAFGEYRDNVKKYGKKESIRKAKESIKNSGWAILFLYFIPAIFAAILYFIAD